MRVEMGKYNGEYIEITGRLKRIVSKNNYCNLLFTNIMHKGEEITQHIWLSTRLIRNKDTFFRDVEPNAIYKMRGKVYVYKKISKIDGTKSVEDFGIRSVRIVKEE